MRANVREQEAPDWLNVPAAQAVQNGTSPTRKGLRKTTTRLVCWPGRARTRTRANAARESKAGGAAASRRSGGAATADWAVRAGRRARQAELASRADCVCFNAGPGYKE